MIMSKNLLLVLLLLPISMAHAGENVLLKHEQTCQKIPPLDARVECIRKEREADAAFEKESRRIAPAPKRSQSAPQKTTETCIKSPATGERVCFK